MMKSSSIVLGFLVCIYIYSTSIEASINGIQGTQKKWCVAQVSAPDDKLKAFLIACCERYNCKAIQPGGSCYQPATTHNHASYALDLYYRNTGNCVVDIGTPAITDPSFGRCHYP